MRQVAFQAKELRRLGREVLKHCSDTLLPLREEIRQHNALSSAISQILGRVRKRGLNATLSSTQWPVWRRDMPRRVSVGNEVLTIMGEALNYQPATLPFPQDDAMVDDQIALDLIDEAALLRKLTQSLPVASLMRWLHEHYPELSDVTILRLYHELIERQDWTVIPADSPDRQPLNTVRVIHHPHALSADARPGTAIAPSSPP